MVFSPGMGCKPEFARLTKINNYTQYAAIVSAITNLRAAC
jgi:hypothetical protein